MDIDAIEHEFLFIEEAKIVVSDFKYLEGKPYYFGYEDAIIESVAVSPFEEQQKQDFVDRWIYSGDEIKELLKFDTHEFDVIVIAHNIHDRLDVYYMGLRLFAKIHQVVYDFPPFPIVV